MRTIAGLLILSLSGCIENKNTNEPYNLQMDGISNTLDEAVQKLEAEERKRAEGSPSDSALEIAQAAVKRAGHKCANITEAVRVPDGNILAQCVDGDHYLIMWPEGREIALNFSATERLIGVSCFQ